VGKNLGKLFSVLKKGRLREPREEVLWGEKEDKDF